MTETVAFAQRRPSEAERVGTRRLPQLRISLPNRKPKGADRVGFDGIPPLSGA